MICLQCKTRNPVGNKFCHECGARLYAPENALVAEEAARADTERREERVAALLVDAMALAERGKPYDALRLAEEAAGMIPDSTSAQALLAALYERTGQNKKAIAAMEAVVALNPESEADRTKLDQLRRGVHVGPVPVRRAPALPSWAPLAAAGAVAAFVLGIGLALVPGDPDRRQVRVAASGSAPVRYVPAPAPVSDAGAPTLAAPPPPARPDPFEPVAGPPAAGRPGASATPAASAPSPRAAAGASQRERRSAASAIPALPPPREGSTEGIAAPPRFRYRTSAGASSRQASPQALLPLDAGAEGGERIRVTPPPAATTPAAAAPSAPPPAQTARIEERAPSGYIRIRVSPPRAEETAGREAAEAAPTPPATEADPLLRAQSLQAAGRYREAAAMYRQAAGPLSGRAAGEAYQALALCEQRLGDAEAARAAYRQAIAAYEAQAATGREAAAARQGIASCRAALEVLGSG